MPRVTFEISTKRSAWRMTCEVAIIVTAIDDQSRGHRVVSSDSISASPPEREQCGRERRRRRDPNSKKQETVAIATSQAKVNSSRKPKISGDDDEDDVIISMVSDTIDNTPHEPSSSSRIPDLRAPLRNWSEACLLGNPSAGIVFARVLAREIAFSPCLPKTASPTFTTVSFGISDFSFCRPLYSRV